MRVPRIDHEQDTYTARVTNGATGLRVTTNGDVRDLIKNAPPAIADTIAWASDKGQVHLDPDYNPSSAVKTDIWADDEEEAPFALNVKITDTDDRVYTSNSLDLYPVVFHNYILVPELTVDGGTLSGGRYFGEDAVGEGSGEPDASISNSLGINDLNKATLSFKVYEGNKAIDKSSHSTIIYTKYGHVNTEDEVETALDLPMAEDTSAWAREVTGDVEWSYALSTGFTGLNVTDKGNGVYDLEAVGNDSGSITVKAKIGRINVALPVYFDVCDTTELMKVNLFLDDADQINKDGSVVNQKLKSSYFVLNQEKNKTIWASENDLNAKYVGEKTDAAGGIKEDGYQLKLANGSALTLPTEDDLDPTIYKEEMKTRMLAGWLVKPNVDGFVTSAVSPDAVVTHQGSAAVVDAPKYNVTGGGFTFYAPGDTIVLLNKNPLDQTYNVAAGIYPVWTDRYEILTAGVYVERKTAGGKVDTHEIGTNWNADLSEQVTVEVPVTSAAFSTGDYDENHPTDPSYTNSAGLAASVSKSTGTTVKLAAIQGLKGVSAITDETNVTGKKNIVFPGYGEWADLGTVEWRTYDAKDALGADNHVAYSHIKAGVLSYDEQTKLGRYEVLESTEGVIADGVIKGKKAGTAFVYATMTDANGNKYWLDKPILVTVKDSDQEVSVDISNVATQTAIKDGIEVGETVQVTTGGITITDGTKILENTVPSTGRTKTRRRKIPSRTRDRSGSVPARSRTATSRPTARRCPSWH